MRIALVTETFLPRIDGVVTRLTNTVRELRAAGDDVLIVAPAAPDMPAEYCGARVVGAPSVGQPIYRGFRVGLPLAVLLEDALDEFAPDLVHVVNPIVLGLAGISLAKRLGVPLVASYHTNVAEYARRYSLGMLEGAGWAYLRSLHNKAQLNLCTSRPVHEMLRGRGFRNVELWEPGVDARRFSPGRRSAAWRARLSDGRPEATLLLYVGRLAKEKCLDRLAPVLPGFPGCHLALVGEGPAGATLRRRFAGLPVTFAGPLYGDDLAAAYASADLFAFPSSTETLGFAAIEAMAAGLPVVGARRGGIPYIVAEGETGVLFDPDARGDLARALGALVADRAERERLGVAARRRAEGWSWSATTAGLRARYQVLLDGAARAAEMGVDAASEPTPRA